MVSGCKTVPKEGKKNATKTQEGERRAGPSKRNELVGNLEGELVGELVGEPEGEPVGR